MKKISWCKYKIIILFRIDLVNFIVHDDFRLIDFWDSTPVIRWIDHKMLFKEPFGPSRRFDRTGWLDLSQFCAKSQDRFRILSAGHSAGGILMPWCGIARLFIFTLKLSVVCTDCYKIIILIFMSYLTLQ